MNRRHFLTSATAVTAALLLGIGASITAGAQNQPPGGQGRPGGGFGGQGRPGGGFGGPGMMGRGNQDPSQSAVMNLVNRDDVRTELLITAQQREQINALQQDSRREMMQKMQEFRQNQNFNPQELQNLSQEEQRAKMEEFQQQMQSMMHTYQGEVDKRLAKILIGKATGGVAQMDRLHQLDLQFRGPLALSDKDVADKFPLTPEQYTKVQAIAREHQTANMQAMMQLFQGQRPPGANGGQPPTQEEIQARQKEMQKRMEALRPELEKSKKAAEAKVVALLTPEQQQKWKDLQGKKFTFRTTDGPPA